MQQNEPPQPAEPKSAEDDKKELYHHLGKAYELMQKLNWEKTDLPDVMKFAFWKDREK
jgi:hypothetical protein